MNFDLFSIEMFFLIPCYNLCFDCLINLLQDFYINPNTNLLVIISASTRYCFSRETLNTICKFKLKKI